MATRTFGTLRLEIWSQINMFHTVITVKVVRPVIQQNTTLKVLVGMLLDQVISPVVIVAHSVVCIHTLLTHLPIFSQLGMQETQFHLWLFTMLNMVGRCSGVCAEDSWQKMVQHKIRMLHALMRTSFMLIVLKIVDAIRIGARVMPSTIR